ncbi:IS66 family transposase [Lacticaseibacillus pantheris]|uniref:IS66 family transposase n=1 Tax=Lacticaseibacillus pantheris TaxID=171523 RepID=UPI002658D461|nr:transposase [Lacticaseibacillus pantheris]WKF85840.1 transposase [Lacticaseibacillus pantheris]
MPFGPGAMQQMRLQSRGSALIYARNQRQLLNRVLDYGEVDLSNNASERNMKSFVIGRKNWLFATSPKGA